MNTRKLIALLLAALFLVASFACTKPAATQQEPTAAAATDAPKAADPTEAPKAEEPAKEAEQPTEEPAKQPEEQPEEQSEEPAKPASKTVVPENKAEDGSGLDFTADYSYVDTNTVPTGVSVHDPSIFVDNGTYYIFGSHFATAKGTNLRSWQYMTNGMIGGRYENVFGNLTDPDCEAFYYTGAKDSVIKNNGYSLWAPDVIYNPTMGKYMMYYCTSSTFDASTICFGVSDTAEGPYVWQANLIYSFLTRKTINDTNALDYVTLEHAQENYFSGSDYNFRDWPNALDPTIFFDRDGRFWMVYGSWSGGIFLLELDPATGLVIHPETDEANEVDAYFGKRLLGGGHKSIEAPYILYDPEVDYYYLYLAYGALNRDGGYQIRVLRSKQVDGPYVDMNGLTPTRKFNHERIGLKLSGNYDLPSVAHAYMATGHNSAMIDTDGKRYIAYHTRYVDGGEMHNPRVKQYFINEEGWPTMLPYQTNGETISETGYALEDVAGRYFAVNQGIKIDANVAKPFVLYLTENGNVFGKGITGTWYMYDGAPYVHITYNDVTYSGVFCAMKDESNNPVMAFSAVGDNTSLWGVKYSDETIEELKEAWE